MKNYRIHLFLTGFLFTLGISAYAQRYCSALLRVPMTEKQVELYRLTLSHLDVDGQQIQSLKTELKESILRDDLVRVRELIAMGIRGKSFFSDAIEIGNLEIVKLIYDQEYALRMSEFRSQGEFRNWFGQNALELDIDSLSLLMNNGNALVLSNAINMTFKKGYSQGLPIVLFLLSKGAQFADYRVVNRFSNSSRVTPFLAFKFAASRTESARSHSASSIHDSVRKDGGAQLLRVLINPSNGYHPSLSDSALYRELISSLRASDDPTREFSFEVLDIISYELKGIERKTKN